MSSGTQKIISSQTAGKSATEIAESVVSFMGPKLAAYVAGEPDGAVSIETISQDVDDRMATAYTMIALISPVDSRETTLLWFVGKNSFLGETAPATAIREGRLSDAVAAAKNFVISG